MRISLNNSKIIFHIDLNAFFCTVATILNPALKGKVFAIGRENTYKGVVSTASYEARKLGVHAGMPLLDAYRLAPNLLVVGCSSEAIGYYHERFVSLLKEYSSLVEVASVDEAYVDMTERCKQFHPLEIAKDIQTRLLELYSLPCSIGIAPTLFLAKMASDMKKPLGVTVLRKREVEKLLFPLPVSEIFGVGKKTYPKIMAENINTIGEFAAPENKSKVLRIVGENTYNYVLDSIYGKTSDIVDANRYSNSQSISTSTTFDTPLVTEDDILFEMRDMCKKLVKKMQMDNYFTKTVTITLRNTDFKTVTRSKSVDYSNNFQTLYDCVIALVEDNYRDEALRLVGVGFSNLCLESDLPVDYNLFTYQDLAAKQLEIEDLVRKYQQKYGDHTIKCGLVKNLIEKKDNQN